MSRLAVFALVVAVLTVSSARVTVAETRAAGAPAGAVKVNINTAGVKELMTLDGVGRGLAEKIVKHREAHGVFKKPADLRGVDGVAGALWEKNRARIVVK
jgi:competence protein ComEA